MNFNGKRILFLSASFFGYEKAVEKRLEKLGATVDYYDERPSNTVVSKGLIRVKRNWYQKTIANYYREIAEKTSKRQYDFFLLIKGESVPFDFLENFKKKHPETEMIFYSYDSVAEYPRFLDLFPFFDRKITFEPSDAEKYGCEFRPLFFLPEYAKSNKSPDLYYDLTFIGSAHTDRFLVGEKVRAEADKLNRKSFFYYYSPGKFAFRMKRLFDKNFKKFDIRKLGFQSMTHAEIRDIYVHSKAILDINKPFQYGLSMRTFESLASGTKLITTNADIVKYPFYDSQNILVINRAQPLLHDEFFDRGFVPFSEENVGKMSMDSWLEAVFLKDQSDYWFQAF